MENPPSVEASAHRRRIPSWLGMLVRAGATAGLMAYALRGVDWPEFRGLLAGADWRWWIAGLTTGIAVQVAAGVRWAALARPLGFPFSRRFFVWRFFEGSFFSLCLPSSIGGDVVKAFRLGSDTPRRLLAACSVLADRLTGVAALGVLALSALASTELRLGIPATLAVAAALLVAAMVAFRIGVGSIDWVLGLFRKPHAAREFIAQLLPYQRRPGLMARAVGWSLVVQMGGALSVALFARSLGVVLPLRLWFTVVPLVSLAIVLPVSINGIGLRESALVTLLGPHGVSRGPAVAVGLMWLAGQVITGLIGGVLFLLDRHTDMRRRSEGRDSEPS
jgi:uncharacterized membrane protein YbhN (UPF0104 family)